MAVSVATRGHNQSAVSPGPLPSSRTSLFASGMPSVAQAAGATARRAVLTAPVLFAVMANELFRADWLPALLLNHWVQLALITPVMLYTGWPIHRIGWLALLHRSAEMNSPITLGTTAAYGYSLVVTVAPGLLPAEVRDVCTKPSASSSP
jgi:cation transport ATPase